MTCYYPMRAFQNDPGKPVHFKNDGAGVQFSLPCGKCLGCRTDRATHWALRCTHEAKQYQSNVFLTLTYDDEHLPEGGCLRPTDLQLFLKRLRKTRPGERIRFFACGEYGDRTQRPHYHALLFNYAAREQHKVGKDLYEAPELNNLWTYGHHKLGLATPAAASYIAQYSLKKIGSGKLDRYGRPQPFLRMSLRPGIGNAWLARYHEDLQNGYIISQDGRKHSIPRSYRKRLSSQYPQLAEQLAGATTRHIIDHPTDARSRERLEAAAIIHQARKADQERRRRL